MTQEEAKVRPCPFCGSTSIVIRSDEGTITRHNTAFGDITRSVASVRWANCRDCGCYGPYAKVNDYKGWINEKEQDDAFRRAVEAWNWRAK